MVYLNFELEAFDYVRDGQGERFRVRVAESPAGEQRLSDAVEVEVPLELRPRIGALRRRELRLSKIVEIGTVLSNLLFPPSVRALLQQSRAALGDEDGLRIRLKLDTYALADLPWEFVYVNDPSNATSGHEGFLVLDRRLSLVRYEVLGQPPGLLSPVGEGALRMVVLTAAPEDPSLPPLDVDSERQAIGRAVAGVPGLRTDIYPEGTVNRLEESLTEPAAIFHFAGHGAFLGELDSGFGDQGGEGYLILEDENRQPFLFPAERLAINLRGRDVRLALFAACESARRDQINPWTGVVPALTRAGIPAVIGMQAQVQDSSSLAFSRRFYRALASGESVDAAVTDGRLAIFNRGGADEIDWAAPALYLRADEGILFPKQQISTPERSWEDVRNRARIQAARFLNEQIGTSQQPGKYEPDLYVDRLAAHGAIDEFLAGEANGLILVGDPGVGKSNLLCHTAQRLDSDGDALFLYNCGGTLSLDIEKEIARDLGLPEGDDLEAALKRLDEQARSAGRRFVLVFDALNEFRSGEGGPADLLRRLDRLVGRAPGTHLKFVLACSSATWNRLQRFGEADLFWKRYFSPVPGEKVLPLLDFTPSELEAAYPRYRKQFGLSTSLAGLSPPLRERLRRPLLLRMFAESYRDSSDPLPTGSLALNIYRRYLQERLQRPRDRLFVDELAAQMLERAEAVLPVDELMRHPILGPEILSEESDSSYARLLDSGVLSENPGDLFGGDQVRFRFSQLGAFVLAQRLQRSGPLNRGKLVALLAEIDSFHLAWDVAQIALILADDGNLFIDLAKSESAELRELAAQSLARLHADDSTRAEEVIETMLQTDEEAGPRTALKAAYYIGAGAREIFLFAAVRGSPQVRQALKNTLYLIWRNEAPHEGGGRADTLYLIWRHDPGFVYELLHELLAQMGLRNLRDLPNILEFVIDLSITIYINHCEREEVIEKTAALYKELALERLHLNLLNTGILGPAFEKIVFRAVAAAFSEPILNTMLFSELAPADQIFTLPPAERSQLTRVAALIEPSADLEIGEADLRAFLDSPILFFNVCAALVLAVHATAHFEEVEELIGRLFDQGTGMSRLWVLLAFAVLLPETPERWIPFLELHTRRLIDENESFFFERPGLLSSADLTLVPLGLAYGKAGRPMPLFRELLAEAKEQPDGRLLARLLEGLAAVGFLYPESLFDLLRAEALTLPRPGAKDAYIHLMATVRILHFDAVDRFLEEAGADESLRRNISAAADVELVHRYIYWLGFFNNAVHFSLYYPKMRRTFSRGALEIMATAKSANEFIVEYTTRAVRLFREANFDLIRWTDPDPEDR